MLLSFLLIAAIGFSLLLATGVIIWCLFQFQTKHYRRAFTVLAVGFLGGLGLSLFYLLLQHWLSESPVIVISESTLVAFGSGFGLAGGGIAIVAQLTPLFLQLFSQSNRWSARRDKYRNHS